MTPNEPTRRHPIVTDNDGLETGMRRVTIYARPVSTHMRSVIERERYHVVCRECPVEHLFEADDDATGLQRAHTDETGHRVVVGRI